MRIPTQVSQSVFEIRDRLSFLLLTKRRTRKVELHEGEGKRREEKVGFRTRLAARAIVDVDIGFFCEQRTT
jgi:hypothetical protein